MKYDARNRSAIDSRCYYKCYCDIQFVGCYGYFNMDGGQWMKKIKCEDCNGSGGFRDCNILEVCQSCDGNGYHIYIEEQEAYGNDCKGGRCE